MSARLLLAGLAAVLLVSTGGVAAADVGSTGDAVPGVDSTAAALSSDVTATRTVNTTEPRPGATVRATATVTLDSERTVDLVDEFDPEFASATLVSVRLNGTEISPDLSLVAPGDVLVSVENVGPGTLEFVYDLAVPTNASAGQTHTLDGVVQIDSDTVVEMNDSQVVATPPTAEFGVELAAVDDPVTVGETVTVNATVTNIGDTTGTQTISFAANGTREDSEELTLAGGENATLAFGYATGAADRPAIDLAVSSANETARTAVEVLAPASFEVSLSAEDAVTIGENVTAKARVTNTGDTAGTQTISFAANDTREDSEELTLAGGENATVAFAYVTDEGDTPAVDLAVSSANETAEATVEVLAPASFEVSLSAEDAVTVGETATVNATVTNGGNVTDTQEIGFAVDGVREGSEELTLSAGETATITFGYATSAADRPAVDLAVSSANETAEATVEVLVPALFGVELAAVDGSVVAGENVTVRARVTNEGNTTGTQEIGFAVDGAREGAERVTLSAGENATVTFAYGTDRGDGPEVEVVVASANETVGAAVEVLAPAVFTVSLDPAEDSVVAGENVTVRARVTNEGDATGTQEIGLAVDGEPRSAVNLTLGGSAGETLAFTYPTGDADAPGIEVSVASANETVTAPIEVLAPASFEVSLSVAESVRTGRTVTATATVTNRGDLNGTETVEFAVGGTQRDSATLTLGAGETEEITFGYETSDADPLELPVAVSTGDDVTRETVSVVGETTFAVTAELLSDTVQAGETVAVEYTVENLGTREGTQTVTVTAAGETLSSDRLTLGAGKTAERTTEYTTAATDAPSAAVTVASSNDTAERTVAVATAAALTPTDIEQGGPVVAGDPLPVTVTVGNDADTEITGPLTLVVTDEAGERLAAFNSTVTVGSAGTERVTFEYATGDASAVTIRAETPGTVTEPVEATVERPPRPAFALSVATADSVPVGGSITVEYTVTNTAEVAGNATVGFGTDGTELDEERVTVPAGGSTTGRFEYTATASDGSSVTLVITAGSASATATVPISTKNGSDDPDGDATADGDGAGLGAVVVGLAFLSLLCYGVALRRKNPQTEAR